VTDNTVLMAMATPVLLLVVIYLIYSIIYFRQPQGAALEGPAVRGNARLQTTWICHQHRRSCSRWRSTGPCVWEEDGAGAGGGPSPLVVPSGPKLRFR